jgi:hypothetical protein
VHYNYDSSFAKDLLNRAGRYLENGSSVADGYTNPKDNPFTAYVHLNLFEGECIPSVNATATEDYSNNIIRNFHDPDDPTAYYPGKNEPYPTNYNPVHRPKGVPLMLSNPDFKIRFLRPLNVEMINPWQSYNETGVVDAVEKNNKVTVKFIDKFRNTSAKFPQDWRGYTDYRSSADCIGYIQGYNDGGDNLWNDVTNTAICPGGKQWSYSRYVDRSELAKPVAARNFIPVPWSTDVQNYQAWTADNVVPNVDHMLTNYGGAENFLEFRLSEISELVKWVPTYNANGNIESITFTYVNDAVNRGDFDIIIPVTVKYAWGDITTTGRWIQTVQLGREDNAGYNLPKALAATAKERELTTRLHNDNMLFVKVHFGQTQGN